MDLVIPDSMNEQSKDLGSKELADNDFKRESFL